MQKCILEPPNYQGVCAQIKLPWPRQFYLCTNALVIRGVQTAKVHFGPKALVKNLAKNLIKDLAKNLANKSGRED